VSQLFNCNFFIKIDTNNIQPQKSIKMEVINYTTKRTDNGLLVITHLSQLLGYVIGFGSLVVPLVLWLVNKDKVVGMNEHGKSIVNFQLSLLLYIIISIPLILLLGLGILTLIGVCLLGFILPIVNAVRASNGEAPSEFMTIRFIS
jgi:uncharacterized Tic20 family protein